MTYNNDTPAGLLFVLPLLLQQQVKTRTRGWERALLQAPGISVARGSEAASSVQLVDAVSLRRGAWGEVREKLKTQNLSTWVFQTEYFALFNRGQCTDAP